MLQVKNISFSYSKTSILKDVSFNLKKGENLAVIGESGSGKSTLLNLIYGEYDLNKGKIFWNEIEILGPKFNLVVGYDFIKQVTQEFDLMPVLSVEDNIAKFLSRFDMAHRQARVSELIKVVELETFAKTKVKFLSGGQKQRVALARALAKEPELLLLDEPFSHIDNFKKQSLRRKVFNYLKQQNISCIVATHDKHDVLGFADTMLVLHDTQIIAKGHPEHLFKKPNTPLVASFFGEYSIIDNSIYYAHQLTIVKHSEFKAVVKRSYFNGTYWLIEARFNSDLIYIHHNKEIKPDTTIAFTFV